MIRLKVRHRWLHIAFASAAVLAVLGTTPNAVAASLPWADDDFPVRVIRQPVTETLKDIAQYLQVTVDISDEIDGTVVDPPVANSAEELFDWICREFDLVWFYDGVVLYVSTSEESGAALVDLQSVSRQSVIDLLNAMALYEQRFIADSKQDVGLMMVGGPPAYRQIVERVVDSMVTRNARLPSVYRGSGTYDSN